VYRLIPESPQSMHPTEVRFIDTVCALERIQQLELIARFDIDGIRFSNGVGHGLAKFSKFR
jgi:hypothetical protein